MAQTPTQGDIREWLEARLGEMGADAVRTVITTEDETLTPEQLPAVRVYAGRASRSRERGLQQRTVTRDWYIVLILKRIGGEDGTEWTAEKKREEELACEEYLELIPDHLAKYPKLQDPVTKKHMQGILAVEEPTDNGLQTITFGKDGAVYFGAVYELPITANRT